MGTIIGGYINPLFYTPALWIDASDASTVTTSGSDVTQINDKSGNGYNFTQGVSANRPTYESAVQNGLNVLRFNGTSDELNLGSSNLFRNVTGGTIYVVRKWAASPTAARGIFKISTSMAASRAQIQGGNVSGKSACGGRTLDADAFVRVDSAASVSTSVFQMQTAVFDIANTDLYQYIDTGLDGSTTSYQSATTTSNIASISSHIGSAGGAAYFNGDIGEIIVYHAAHTAEQRSQVWAYLKHKWAI